MEFTNKFLLPLPIVLAITQDTYQRGTARFTTTGIISPPRISILKKQHGKDIQEDVSDLLYRVMGQTKHLLLENAAKGAAEKGIPPERFIIEKRLYSEIDGYSISGQIDLYDSADKTLYDYKETSHYKAIYKDTSDWDKQGNINKFHCENNGIEVDRIVNVALLRDWKMSDAKRDPQYPQCALVPFDLKIWTREETEKFIRERIKAHVDAEKELPECTAEERWERPTKYAIIKAGKKRAVKVWDSQSLAEAHLKTLDAKHTIEFRPGEQVRCANWCAVSDFCSQWQKLKASLPAAQVSPDSGLETAPGEF